MQYILVFLGGGAGAIARFACVRLSKILFPINFPYGTLLVNFIGAAIIGILMAYFQKSSLPHISFYNLLIVGFLGGFTTFSAFSYESFAFIMEQEFLKAIFNIFLNVLLCLLATSAGYYLIKYFF